jgi:hypothetical protein
LTRPGYSAAEIDKMHQEDLADEARITAEITAPAVTLSQSAQMTSKQPDRVLDTPMDSLPELDLARALLNSGYPVILPPSCVVQKLSTSKEALWVRFTFPCEYAGKTIQMYPKRLEPKKGPACGYSHQHAASTFLLYAKATGFYDCRVR